MRHMLRKNFWKRIAGGYSLIEVLITVLIIAVAGLLYALMLVVDLNGPTMMAHIGVMRALNRDVGRRSIHRAKTRIGESIN